MSSYGPSSVIVTPAGTATTASSNSSGATPTMSPVILASGGGAVAGAVTSPNTATATSSTSNGGAVQPYVFRRDPPPKSATALSTTLFDTLTGTSDLSATFWKPDAAKGEYSLLAALVKRGAQGYAGGGATTDYLPLAMRPDIELANNFSNFRGERIDLSAERFKHSKATQALQQLNRAPGDGVMHVADVKAGLRSGISQMQTDEYFLVKYRDYSDFAVAKWSDESRRERVLSPLFVDKFFAVRVGATHGVFVPISEAQFVRGNEALSTINMAPEAVADNKLTFALNADQFRSLGVPSTEFDPVRPANGGGADGGANADDDLDLPPPPHPLDWSAEACNTRWRRFKRRQLNNAGRIALRAAVVGGVSFYVYYYYIRSTKASGGNNQGAIGNEPRRRRKTSGQIIKDLVSLPINVLGWAMTDQQQRHYTGGDYDD